MTRLLNFASLLWNIIVIYKQMFVSFFKESYTFLEVNMNDLFIVKKISEPWEVFWVKTHTHQKTSDQNPPTFECLETVLHTYFFLEKKFWKFAKVFLWHIFLFFVFFHYFKAAAI